MLRVIADRIGPDLGPTNRYSELSRHNREHRFANGNPGAQRVHQAATGRCRELLHN